MNSISSLYLVLGMDFSQTNHEIQPGLAETEGTKSIINEASTRLSAVIKRLREVKIERMQRESGRIDEKKVVVADMD
ncbi:65-kDa microtubule-associated protein 3-like protein [Tanacetum coccineum]